MNAISRFCRPGRLVGQLDRTSPGVGRIVIPAGCAVLAIALATTAAAQDCGDFNALSATYAPDCVLHVEADTDSFSECRGVMEGYLLVRVYRGAASADGGVLVGSERTPCDWPGGAWAVKFSSLPVPGGTPVFVEGWVKRRQQTNPQFCTGPIELVHVTPGGDIDGDGVSDCDDACPLDPNQVTPGMCGCGVKLDSDGDGTPDCGGRCPGPGCEGFCPGDVNGDVRVDNADLQAILDAWASHLGDAAFAADADFDGNGVIDNIDLQLVLDNWGRSCAAEIAVLDCDPPATGVTGDAIPISFTLYNAGAVTVSVPVTCRIGNNSNQCTVSVPAYSTVTSSCSVTGPPSDFDCGGADYYPVTLQVNYPDANTGNQICQSSIGIIERYWDLHFEIINADQDGWRCQCGVDWTVRVTNLGTMDSPSVCFITGINCAPGAGYWGCNLGRVPMNTGVIPSGASRYYPVRNVLPNGYCVACNAFTGTQYIKAEIHYSGGCWDNCHNGSNYAEVPIEIH